MLYVCSSVIAIEDLVVKILATVDPVFSFSNKSGIAEQFLKLDDTIFDDIRRQDAEDLPEHKQHALLDGQRLLSLLDRRLGPQHVQMSRKVPSALTQGSSAADICTIVRCCSSQEYCCYFTAVMKLLICADQQACHGRRVARVWNNRR
jgi:hypothetical protein